MDEMERIPLAERLERLEMGVITPGHSTAVVSRWAQMSLDAYLDGQDTAKERVEGILGPNTLSITYQEAALRTHRLLEKPVTRKKGLDMLWYLSFPLQVAYKRRETKT